MPDDFHSVLYIETTCLVRIRLAAEPDVLIAVLRVLRPYPEPFVIALKDIESRFPLARPRRASMPKDR